MLAFIQKYITNILLTIIVVILAFILFEDKIRMYFKAQEVLQKVNVFNIPYVAVKCSTEIASDNDTLSQECLDMVESYNEKVLKWQNLIKEYRDINCKDFTDKKEADEFYHYISGELSSVIYTYRKFDGHCRYDPYGLDTNGDCNACENYD